MSSKCENCGTSMQGTYCHECGQKYLAPSDKTIRSLLKEGLHFTFNFDGHVWRTFKSVLFKPGTFATAYTNGQRKQFMKPVNAVIVVSILYLLFPILRGLNMSFDDYGGVMFFTDLVQQHISSHLIQVTYTVEELASRFDGKSSTTAKFVLLLMIPFFTLFVWLLHFRSKKMLYENAILGIELSIFYILGLFVVFPMLLLPFSAFFRIKIGENTIALMFIAIITINASIAFHRFYQQRWWMSIVKGFIFSLLTMTYILSLHKYLVFFFTMIQL